MIKIIIQIITHQNLLLGLLLICKKIKLVDNDGESHYHVASTDIRCPRGYIINYNVTLPKNMEAMKIHVINIFLSS